MLQLQEMTELLARFADTPVLVIGDLMIDEYIWGHVNRISPEAPVQVVEADREEYMLGGAGNVVKNLVSLEAQVFVSSMVDEDETGTQILDELVKLGVSVDGVFRESGRVSSRKTRVLSLETNQQILRIDRESVHPVSRSGEDRIAGYVEKHCSSFSAIVLSDYLKGVLTEALTSRIIDIASSNNLPVIVDPKGRNYARYRGATLITPNRKEAETVLGTDIVDEESLRKAGRALLSRFSVQSILITLGKDGMALFQKGRRVYHIPAEKKEVFDVTGAGDTVISLMGLCVASGIDMGKAIDIANIAAGIVVGKTGTATVTIQEIIDEVLEHKGYSSSRIMELKPLARLVEEKKRNGKTVVFTNGCFDILHAGHTSFLQQARKLGDLLIVGLNSDASVRRLKGPHRPVVPMAERASILSSIAGVDYVVGFEEDTPIRLIRTIRPDILVKGDDYTREQVVGLEEVESYGGRVELIRLVDGVSTSSIIERIAKTVNKKT
jgi:D-beta-D-heptose 7-phosphate kinase/D-beta-D-heptose 1-phosphate adenosyltransferase